MNRRLSIIGRCTLLMIFWLALIASAKAQDRLEYWFDDNFGQRASTPINTATGEAWVINLDMSDVAKFPPGIHRLNMRVVGNDYSPIYSDWVLRLPNGGQTGLTCWLDDDYENRQDITGNSIDGRTIDIGSSLDFSSVPSGMHRLKFRVTTNGFDDGPIYEEPVMVTRLYNNQTDVTVVKESHWFDNIISIPTDIFNPQSIVTKEYTLDPKNYPIGQHVFYVQFRNSAGVWGEPNATYFYKEESGKLYAGRMPTELTGIEHTENADNFSCSAHDGTLFIDCQSPKLASTGVIVVCDQTGKVIARQTVNSKNGIHAEVNVKGPANRLVIVRLLSGDVNISKKIIIR